MRPHLIISLLFILLLCSGCSKKKKSTFDELSLIIPAEKQSINNIPKKTKKSKLHQAWHNKSSVMFSEAVDCSAQLKAMAHSFGLSLNIKTELRLDYSAKQKAFIDILLDIGDQFNLMLTIDGVNGRLEDDLPCLHNYDLGNLSSSIGTEFLTSVDHSFGNESKGNVSKNSYKNNNNYYDLINQNLTIIIPKPFSFTINSQAGIITVIAPQKLHKKVSRYLRSIKQRVNDQILVEAKLLEVYLFEEHSSGVDLEAIKNALVTRLNVALPKNFSKNGILTFFSGVGDAFLKNFIISYLSVYGSTSSISNPYLLISNNHVGTFKALENKIYFKFKSETILGSGYNKHDSTNKQSEFSTYPIGVIFSVHAVLLENGLIKLYIRCSLSEVSKEIKDAGYIYVTSSNGKNVSSDDAPKIPEVKSREVETVLVLRDGECAIIGGFMDSNSRSEVQVLKNSKNSKKSELIILLKVQSIDNSEEEDPYDFLIIS